MSGIIEKTLPFPRGAFYSEASHGGSALVTMGDSTAKNLEGRRYQVEDTIHKTNRQVILRVVKNDSGGALPVQRRLMSFNSNTTDDFGHRVDDYAATPGVLCKPLDDAYYYGPQPKYTTSLELTISDRAVETTIVEDELYYVVDCGPCDVEFTAANKVSAGGPVSADVLGLAKASADILYEVGTALEDGDTAAITATLIDVHPGLFPRGTNIS